jgi:hypothetical protein
MMDNLPSLWHGWGQKVLEQFAKVYHDALSSSDPVAPKIVSLDSE